MEAKVPDFKFHVNVQGFYRIQKFKHVNGKRILNQTIDWFPNLITNIGLDRMAYSGSGAGDYLRSCMVGSGNTAPAVTDNSLGAQVAATANNIYVSPNPIQSSVCGYETTSPYYCWIITTYRFFEGEATGNIAEVGIGWWDDPNWRCFSRALILDGGGSPTTITVLADESLDVTYELRFYPKETDNTGNVTFTGSIGGTYAWTMRSAYLGVDSYLSLDGWQICYRANNISNRHMMQLNSDYGSGVNYLFVGDGSLGTINQIPTSSNQERLLTPIEFDTYVAGNFYVDGTITVGLDDGNFVAGISVIHFIAGLGWFQIGFGTPIMKTNTDILTITFRHTWGRV
jgi:hypothetical protein